MDGAAGACRSSAEAVELRLRLSLRTPICNHSLAGMAGHARREAQVRYEGFHHLVFRVVFALVLTFVAPAFHQRPLHGNDRAWCCRSSPRLPVGTPCVAGAVPLPTHGRSGIGHDSAAPVFVFALFAALIERSPMLKIFDMAKVDYTSSDIAYHLLLVALAAFTIRMAGNSVNALR